MRNLTIKRTKGFVGCLAKANIYVEDYNSKELTINSIPCRKIGILKNGEVKTFEIDEQATKVFVIADKLTKNYCNDFYQLYYGHEDVFLSGKNKFNLANGNAFRFDNNNNKEALANRRHSTKKGLIVFIITFIISVIIGFFIGFNFALSSSKANPKTFYSNGISITLTDKFIETDVENFTVAYDSKNVAVFALEEPFTLADGFEEYTLEEYAELVIETNNLDTSKIDTYDGLTYFTHQYENTDTNETYQYYSYVYKTDEAFWLVQFATLEENTQDYVESILTWAKSIDFSN